MTEKRFENRLDKSNVKFNTLNPTWDNEKETGLNVFEMIDEMNSLNNENEWLKEEKDELKQQLNDLQTFDDEDFIEIEHINNIYKKLGFQGVIDYA